MTECEEISLCCVLNNIGSIYLTETSSGFRRASHQSSAVERREKGRKLILPLDEVEENQVVPPKRRKKRRKLILPPNEVKENQEAVVTANPAAIVEAGIMQTLPEVNKTVAAPETPRVRDERKEAKAYLASRLSGGKPNLSSSSVQRKTDKTSFRQIIVQEAIVTADPAAIVEARITQTLLKARRAKRTDLLSEAETSIKELEMIELREQRLCAQIEVDEYDQAQILLELKEVEAQIGASEMVIDALASQAMEATIVESEAKSFQKSINLEIDNVKDLVTSTLAFIK
ncbi:hypothetical protein Pyn_34235 [Prunus yedoensis var. nudiflora]|uniref:Uncharacterized protein n=1 Tax=Prunus yedoensis var. nudiflora TaxID=2094558 RepID=A0A314Z4Q5_PRUYE|nr:hypothetical protein Pyn_34235 [Prunus yedoensis var. nudiflora]